MTELAMIDAHFLQIEGAKLLPLRHDNERMAPFAQSYASLQKVTFSRIFFACGIPTGSMARTSAPMSSNAVINGIDGASRMSSVLGLNVIPETAMDFPRKLPPNAFATLRMPDRCRSGERTLCWRDVQR